MVQSLSRDAYGGFQEMVIANPVRARYLREMRQGSGEKAMSMEPTNMLRWVKRQIAWSSGWINKIEEVRVLQVLWLGAAADSAGVVGIIEEWRDVPTEEG